MPSIIDELAEGNEAQVQEIFEALKEMTKTFTLPIEHYSGIGNFNSPEVLGRAAYMFSQAATICFSRLRDSMGTVWDKKGVRVHPRIEQAMEEVNLRIAQFASKRAKEAQPGIFTFFYAELGYIMLSKAQKYSPALWTSLEAKVLQELVDWV